MAQTRTVTEYKLYKLRLNLLTAYHKLDAQVVAISEDYDELVDWYNSQHVEPYEDGEITKYFEKGSELENYRPVDDLSLGSFDADRFGIGVLETWVSENTYNNYMNLMTDGLSDIVTLI